MDSISFRNRVAIVTGAGRGMGRDYALELARRGASVVVNDIGPGDAPGISRAHQVVAEIEALGGRATASNDSVATPEGGEALTALALETFGTVDIVINNAGFLRRGMFEDMPIEHVREILDVHLLGAFNVTQPAWRVMKAKGYGRVVLTSSGASFGMQGNSNYVAAKAALIGLASALAMEGAAFDIKVNALMPFARSMIQIDSPATAVAASDAARNLQIQGELGPRATFAAVSAATLYLASEVCALSGETISAVAGRYARLFKGFADGWVAPSVDEVTPETFRDNLASIVDVSSAREIRSLTEDFGGALAAIQSAGG